MAPRCPNGLTMDTFEARLRIWELGREGLDLVDGLAGGHDRPGSVLSRLRELATEARGALPDAGFPAESTWRALQQASAASLMGPGEFDQPYWVALAEDLRAALSTLESLLSSPTQRDIDFRIIG